MAYTDRRLMAALLYAVPAPSPPLYRRTAMTELNDLVTWCPETKQRCVWWSRVGFVQVLKSPHWAAVGVVAASDREYARLSKLILFRCFDCELDLDRVVKCRKEHDVLTSWIDRDVKFALGCELTYSEHGRKR